MRHDIFSAAIILVLFIGGCGRGDTRRIGTKESSGRNDTKQAGKNKRSLRDILVGKWRATVEDERNPKSMKSIPGERTPSVTLSLHFSVDGTYSASSTGTERAWHLCGSWEVIDEQDGMLTLQLSADRLMKKDDDAGLWIWKVKILEDNRFTMTRDGRRVYCRRRR